MSDFVSFLLLGFILVIKLRNFDFESHRNTFNIFDKNNDVKFEYVLSNIVWFGLSFGVWLYVPVMSRTCFRVNANSIVAWSMREIWSLSDCNWTRTHNHLVHKRKLNHLAKYWPVWLNSWVFFYELSGCRFESSCSHLNFGVWVKKYEY